MLPEVDFFRQELLQIPRILLVRLRSLGDAILTLPLIEALHRWRPDLKQSILIEAPFADVFLQHPAVDETLILQKGKRSGSGSWTRLEALFELKRRRYPAVLNLHGGTTSMLFTAASGAPLRLGQESHRGSWLYTGRIPSSAVVWDRQPIHTVEHQLSVLRWLGIPVSTLSGTLHVSQAAQVRVQKRLAGAGLSEFLLIQPTATLPTKQWKAANFAKLGDSLFAHCHLPVVYTAAPHEAAVLKEIRQVTQERHIYWSDLPLMDLFALIERCRIFVGCDSGPTHAAAALKKPLVVVWGSSNFDAWHPWGTEYEAVRSELACIPCPGYTCREFGEPKCILDIPVSQVAEACARMIERASHQPQRVEDPKAQV